MKILLVESDATVVEVTKRFSQRDKEPATAMQTAGPNDSDLLPRPRRGVG